MQSDSRECRRGSSRAVARLGRVRRANVSPQAADALHSVPLLADRWRTAERPYGQLLSHRELSTTGRTTAAPAAGAEDDPHGDQAFLYGALDDALGPVHLEVTW